MTDVSFVNHLHPGDVVSAVTFVKSLDENISGDMESLVVCTLGLKNCPTEVLEEMEFPINLFDGSLTTKQVEKICKEKIPALSNKIVVAAERRIIRQASRGEPFLL